MDTFIESTNKEVARGGFPLYFYYRIANQLISQAKAYRDEGNMAGLHTTLDRYYRLLEVIPEHQIYSAFSAKEKLHHNKVKCCGIAENKFWSFGFINEEIGLAPMYTVDFNSSCLPEPLCSRPSMIANECPHLTMHTVTHSFPLSVISCVENVPEGVQVSHIEVADSKHGKLNLHDTASASNVLQAVHISGHLMDDFLELAKDNTKKDLETCGVLGAFVEKGIFYVTTLIIPKQESTSNTCQALHEEEIFAIQKEHSLFPVGWIHTHPSQSCFMSSVDLHTHYPYQTHPSQSCFMSSVDLHTHYPYQVMVPEAFAIVMAPTDTSRNYGIFRLSDPGGMSIVKNCREEGFHNHKEASDGNPIYDHCSNVYINPNLRFEIFDLR